MNTTISLIAKASNFYKYYVHELPRIRKSKAEYLKNEINRPGNYYSNNVFDYYRCIFVHIPKAAGVSVSKSLFGNYGQGHRTIKDYQKKFHKYTFKRYFKFTIVRNPYDRLLSAYFFLKKGGMNETDKEFSIKYLQKIKTFDEFVINHMDNDFVRSYVHFYPQVHFLKDNEDTIQLDFIGRFENILQDFKIICENLGISSTLRKTNTGNQINNSWEVHYTKPMIKKIYGLYKEDFDLLGYDCTL